MQGQHAFSTPCVAFSPFSGSAPVTLYVRPVLRSNLRFRRIIRIRFMQKRLQRQQ
jgi:hypothetical protein